MFRNGMRMAVAGLLACGSLWMSASALAAPPAARLEPMRLSDAVASALSASSGRAECVVWRGPDFMLADGLGFVDAARRSSSKETLAAALGRMDRMFVSSGSAPLMGQAGLWKATRWEASVAQTLFEHLGAKEGADPIGEERRTCSEAPVRRI